ncbi:hypothetical protein KIL84_014394 [Mauremys mutica]|uniref:Uncharacterized protein n=1 Tax=Mauremys mutica TaxID=74926 RepID=A0A9D4B756_9SAUR|nr:hypothetical protein KIL84_014394 [Mauremys mutica]
MFLWWDRPVLTPQAGRGYRAQLGTVSPNLAQVGSLSNLERGGPLKGRTQITYRWHSERRVPQPKGLLTQRAEEPLLSASPEVEGSSLLGLEPRALSLMSSRQEGSGSQAPFPDTPVLLPFRQLLGEPGLFVGSNVIWFALAGFGLLYSWNGGCLPQTYSWRSTL